jgi:hypothetical protein
VALRSPKSKLSEKGCQGLNRLLGCNVGVLLYICKNDGALMAVKLYIRLCAAHDKGTWVVGGDAFYALKSVIYRTYGSFILGEASLGL